MRRPTGVRRILALTLLLVLTGACAGASGDAGDAGSGITGVVLLGPQCAVEQVGSPCPDVPTEAQVQVTTTDGSRVVALGRTDAEGRFRLNVEPGDYLAQAIPIGQEGIVFGKPVNVTVVAGRFTETNLSLDNGIR